MINYKKAIEEINKELDERIDELEEKLVNLKIKRNDIEKEIADTRARIVIAKMAREI